MAAPRQQVCPEFLETPEAAVAAAAVPNLARPGPAVPEALGAPMVVRALSEVQPSPAAAAAVQARLAEPLLEARPAMAALASVPRFPVRQSIMAAAVEAVGLARPAPAALAAAVPEEGQPHRER